MDKRTIIFVFALSLAFFGIKFGFNYYDTQKRDEWLKIHGPELAKKAAQNPKKADQAPIEKAEPNAFVETKKSHSQEYYVLENAYQQLVFSNVGGSLVEINLPFQSE